MNEKCKDLFDNLIYRHPQLKEIKENILKSYDILEKTYNNNKKLLLCGNGGSAADCEHIVGELMKSFRLKRKIDDNIHKSLKKFGEDGKIISACLEGSLPAISLTSHISLSTAYANDREPKMAFAQQLYGLANKGDTLIAISTSGNSTNCILAATLAKAMGVQVIALTGAKESQLSKIADITIRVPETETFKIQELHLPIYHCLCAMLEETFFG